MQEDFVPLLQVPPWPPCAHPTARLPLTPAASAQLAPASQPLTERCGVHAHTGQSCGRAHGVPPAPQSWLGKRPLSCECGRLRPVPTGRAQWDAAPEMEGRAPGVGLLGVWAHVTTRLWLRTQRVRPAAPGAAARGSVEGLLCAAPAAASRAQLRPVPCAGCGEHPPRPGLPEGGVGVPLALHHHGERPRPPARGPGPPRPHRLVPEEPSGLSRAGPVREGPGRQAPPESAAAL